MTGPRNFSPLLLVQRVVVWLFLFAILNVSLLPKFGSWLYVSPLSDESTKSSHWHVASARNEYLWIVLSNAFFMSFSYCVIRTSIIHRRRSIQDQDLSDSTLLQSWFGSERRAWRNFLVVNLMWFIVLVGYALFKAFTVGNRPPFDTLLAVVGGKAAWPALWNTAASLFLVQRWCPLLGKHGLKIGQTRTAQLLHAWCGHAVLGWLVMHALLLSWQYWLYQTGDTDHSSMFSRAEQWWSLMVPYYGPIYTEGHVNFAGWLSLAGIIFLRLASRQWVKKASFEVFIVGHILGALLFIVGANLHDYNTFFILQLSLATFAADWILRRTATFMVRLKSTPVHHRRSNSEQRATEDDSSYIVLCGVSPCYPVIQMSIPIPPGWSTSTYLEPGAFVRLSISPTTEPTSHPFSISHVSSTHFTIHIKNLGNWTDALIGKHLQKYLLHDDHHEWQDEEQPPSMSDSPELSLKFEGPYGSAFDWVRELASYEKRIFLGAGVGLAGLAPLCSQEDLVFWWVSKTAEYQSMATLLDGIDLVQVFITKEIAADTRGEIRSKRIPACLTLSDRPLLREGEDSLHNFLFFPEWIGAVIGSLASLFLARLVCYNESFISDREPYHYHTCSAFSVTEGLACQSCDTPNHQQDGNDLPCCLASSCLYCFRGLPMILSFVLSPLCAAAASYWKSRRIKILFRKWSWREHEPITFVEEHDHGNHDINGVISTSMPEAPLVLHNNHTVKYSRVPVTDILKQCLPCENDKNTAVIVCGPDNFICAVQDACSCRVIVVNHPSLTSSK